MEHVGNGQVDDGERKWGKYIDGDKRVGEGLCVGELCQVVYRELLHLCLSVTVTVTISAAVPLALDEREHLTCWVGHVNVPLNIREYCLVSVGLAHGNSRKMPKLFHPE